MCFMLFPDNTRTPQHIRTKPEEWWHLINQITLTWNPRLIALQRQSLSQLCKATEKSWPDMDSLRVILRFPSFQLFQTEETLRYIWTIVRRGVNKPSFGHLQNQKKSIKRGKKPWISAHTRPFFCVDGSKGLLTFCGVQMQPSSNGQPTNVWSLFS